MSKHPYEEYERTAIWRILDKSLHDLVGNKDLQECTHRDYIVGYLVKKLSDERVLKVDALTKEQGK